MADMAQATNPTALAAADVYAACKAFVLSYALPALLADCVIQGWQNLVSLPPGSNDYAVISILSDTQHGTTLESFSADNPDNTGILTVKSLVELNVQIDFCAQDDCARSRARHLAIVSRSSLGVEFFNRYGVSCLYADDARDISFVGDARQFVRRWMTTLHLSVNQGISVEYPYFDNAQARIEDVDEHHPVKRS